MIFPCFKQPYFVLICGGLCYSVNKEVGKKPLRFSYLVVYVLIYKDLV